MRRWIGLLLVFASLPAFSAEVKLEKKDDGVHVTVDGKPFTVCIAKSGAKPVLWPVIGPTGKEMTRAYPLAKVEGEKTDHIHHRSLWFTHGDVNGVSFWMEDGKHGQIDQTEIVKTESGPVGVLVTKNVWNDPDGKSLAEEVRKLTFGATAETRWIDIDSTLTPVVETLTFGDTKEGSVGVRVAHALAVDSKQGGKIVNSAGQTDAAAWGKPAAWVDYHGPLNGEHVGVAILNHPQSFRHQTTWHVRTYGLFTANPFGLKDFTGDKSKDGSHTLKKGESLRMKHRVVLHRGDEKEGKIAEAFAAYAEEGK